MADQEKIVIEIETLIKTGQIDQARAKIRSFADDVILNNKRIEKSSKEALVSQDRRLRAMSGIQHAKVLANDAPPGYFNKPGGGKTSYKWPMMPGESLEKGLPYQVWKKIRATRQERAQRKWGEGIREPLTPFNRWSPEMADWQAWSQHGKSVGSARNIEDILGAWHGRSGIGQHRLRAMSPHTTHGGMRYSRALGGLRSPAGIVGDMNIVPQQTIEGMERADANAKRAAEVQPFDSIDDLVTMLQKKLDWMGQNARKSKDDLVNDEDAILDTMTSVGVILGGVAKIGKKIKGAIKGPDYSKVSATMTGSFFRYLAGDVIVGEGGRTQPVTARMAAEKNKALREQIASKMGQYGKVVSFQESETDIMTKNGIRPITGITATFKAGSRPVDEFSASMANLRRELATLPHAMDPVTRFQYSNNKQLDMGTRLSARFSELGEKARGKAWAFTWMSMSMLGVYFSLNNLINLGMKGFSMFTQKLMDLEGVLTAFGMLQAFGAMAGLDVSKFPLDIERLIDAWMKLTALFSAGTVMIADLAAAIFGDPEVVEAFASALEHVADIFYDENFRDTLKELAKNAADVAKNFADIVAWCIPLLAGITGIKIGGFNLASIFLIMWLAAGLLMPILADLAAIVLIAGKAFDLAAWLIAYFAEGAAAAGGWAAYLVSAFTAIVVVVLIIMEVFGLWKYVVSGLTWTVTELMVSIWKMAQAFDQVFLGGGAWGYYEQLIGHARSYWAEYNKGLMETQGGLASVLNYSQLLGNIQIPTMPGSGTTGYGGMGATAASGATTLTSPTGHNITINNYNDYGGVNATEDQLKAIQERTTRDNMNQLVTALNNVQGV